MIADEPERAALTAAILGAERCRTSAASWIEAAIAIDRRGDPVLSGEPILFKGNDFGHTDIRPALT